MEPSSLRASIVTVACAALACISLVFCCAGASVAAAGGTISSIAVGAGPQGVASDGTDVWVADEREEAVTEIEASTGAVLRTIKVGSHPLGVAADGSDVWVANQTSDTVTEIEASTGTVVRTINIGEEAQAIYSDGTHVWATSTFGESLSRIDIATGTVLHIPLKFRPKGVVSDGTHVWVANWLQSQVSERGASTGAVVATIATESSPFGLSYDGAHVWVAEEDPTSTVQEIDPTSATVVATVNGVFGEPEQISSDGAHVWVASRQGPVTEIDASSAAIVNTLNVGARASGGVVDVSSDGTDVWVTSPVTDKVIEFPTGFTAECASNTGTINLSPGLSGTAAVQTLSVKGTLSGCVGENFTQAKYKATLKTPSPVSCSALSTAGEPASGSAKFNWTPKKANAAEGPLEIPLSEALGGAFSSEVKAPSGFIGSSWLLKLSGQVAETFKSSAQCGSKPVKKGFLSGSGVSLDYLR